MLKRSGTGVVSVGVFRQNASQRKTCGLFEVRTSGQKVMLDDSYREPRYRQPSSAKRVHRKRRVGASTQTRKVW